MEAERALAATHNFLLLPLRREAVTRPEGPTPLQYKPTDRQPFPRLLDKDVNRKLETFFPYSVQGVVRPSSNLIGIVVIFNA